MKKYEIIVRDMDTGEPVICERTDCIIGAVLRDDCVRSISCAGTGTFNILHTCASAQEVIDRTLQKLQQDHGKRRIKKAYRQIRKKNVKKELDSRELKNENQGD